MKEEWELLKSDHPLVSLSNKRSVYYICARVFLDCSITWKYTGDEYDSPVVCTPFWCYLEYWYCWESEEHTREKRNQKARHSSCTSPKRTAQTWLQTEEYWTRRTTFSSPSCTRRATAALPWAYFAGSTCETCVQHRGRLLVEARVWRVYRSVVRPLPSRY